MCNTILNNGLKCSKAPTKQHCNIHIIAIYEASLNSMKNKIESLEFDAITKNIENKNLNKRISELEKLNEDLTEKNSG